MSKTKIGNSIVDIERVLFIEFLKDDRGNVITAILLFDNGQQRTVREETAKLYAEKFDIN